MAKKDYEAYPYQGTPAEPSKIDELLAWLDSLQGKPQPSADTSTRTDWQNIPELKPDLPSLLRPEAALETAQMLDPVQSFPTFWGEGAQMQAQGARDIQEGRGLTGIGNIASGVATQMASFADLATLGLASGVIVRPGTKIAKKAALKLLGRKKEPSAITDINLRNLPDIDSAIKIARGELHLITKKDGGFVGAPDWIKSKKDLRKMRLEFDRKVNEGNALGHDWYHRVRSSIRGTEGPNPRRQTETADELALFSAQRNPNTNLGYQLKTRLDYETGVRPVTRVNTQAQTDKYVKARETGERLPLGLKTGMYSDQLNPTWKIPITGVNDIQIGRAFQYSGIDGAAFSKGFSTSQHSFLDAETVLAVDRANQRNLGGRSDWTAGEIQASAWISEKATKEMKRFPNKFANKGNALAWAAEEYTEHHPKYTVQETLEESVAGAGTGMFPGLLDRDYAQRELFGSGTGASWFRGQEKRDPIADVFAQRQQSTLDMTGAYEPKAGGLEVNPGQATRILMALAEDPKGKVVDPVAASLMTKTAGLRAYADMQNAGAWHKFFVWDGQMTKNLTDSNSIRIPLEGPLGEKEMKTLFPLADKNGFLVTDSGQGVVLFPQPWLGADDLKNLSLHDGKILAKKLTSGLDDDIKKAVNRQDIRLEQGRVQSDYIDYESFSAAESAGKGLRTKKLFEVLDEKTTPDFIKRLDADTPEADAVRQIIMNKWGRNFAYHQVTGDPIRMDQQLALQILGGEHKKYRRFEGLRQAMKDGKVIPAVALPVFGLAMRESYED